MHKVKIRTTQPPHAEVWIDEKKIEATKFTFEHEAGSLATLTLYGYKDADIEEDGRVIFDNEWVAVSEKHLPSPKEWVLAQTIEGDKPLIARIGIDGKWYADAVNDDMCLNDFTRVIAWKPLPKPYRAE